MDFADWADESYEIASTSVYDGVDENKAVPEEYIEKNTEIALQRIVLGGYRLAYLLTQLNLDQNIPVTSTPSNDTLRIVGSTLVVVVFLAFIIYYLYKRK